MSGQRAIAVAALMATYLQALNISVPNAALQYIQGALSMADDGVGWIFTSYIVASLVTMPMAGWLAGRFGRKTVYLVSIAVLALGLVLATWAQTPLQFVAARVIQGAGSGPLGPLSIAMLLDVLPPARHARVSMLWTVTSVIGILSGPTIGGWLSEYEGWHMIFTVSLPVLAFIALTVAVSLPEKRAAQSGSFDFFGLASFSMGMIGLQMLLDRGERMEWFDSAEIWAEAVLSAFGFYAFIVHVLTRPTHFLNKALLGNRNYVLSTIMFFMLGFVLLPTIALTSPMLDELLGYPAALTGYMALPRSMALVAGLIVTMRVLPRVDMRLAVAAGMALVVYGNWRMLGYSPAMDWRPVVIAGMAQGAGLGIMMPALTKAAFSTLDPAFRAEGAAFFTLARFYGSTIGIALVQFYFYDNTQAMHIALARQLTPYRPAAHVAGAITLPHLAALNAMVTDQAAFIGLIGQFKLLMIAMLIVSPLVLLLRKPQPVA